MMLIVMGLFCTTVTFYFHALFKILCLWIW